MGKTRKHSSKRHCTRKMSGGQQYKKDVSEPWFSLIKIGKKTVEGRLGKNEFAEMKEGDIITFINKQMPFERQFHVKITQINNYNTFREYLSTEGLDKSLPGIDTIEQGVEVYYQYYKADEGKYPVRAIHMELVREPEK